MIYPSTFEQKLGFDRIRQMITEYCLCELGRLRVEDMKFSIIHEDIILQLELTDELRRILLFEETFPQENYIDSSTCLKKLRIPGTYPEVPELNDFRKSLETLKGLTQFFLHENIKIKYPTLAKEAAVVVLFPYVYDRIELILNKHGQIKDNASPALHEIRDDIKQKQISVTRRMLQLLKAAQQDGITEPDAEITIRDGRPVIPVNSSNKRKLGGIIHDESATGKTAYIEPAAVVELNNELRELEYAERREILKILTTFADDIRPYIDELLEAYNYLGTIDFLRAKAKLAIKINAGKPILQKVDFFSWRSAIHPLLYLSHKTEGKEIVPLDLKLDIENRILLISGPNAGGKSVCLKTTGLLQYMLQCGLLVPMGENSEVCIFDNIFIDIGDEQSLENDLSTYSSHLLNMKFFLKNANKQTLILIDEFGTGTEPALGGAIAEALLEELNSKKVFGVITTHYSNLKHFGAETSGIINGAMLFDTQNIRPLFKLAMGKPGSSFAIDIARKIGLPENILKSASDKVGEDYINFEKHLREISRDRKYWEEKRGKIRKVERTLDDLYLNYSNELVSVQAERKKIIANAKTEAQQILKEANKKIENTIREIRETQADKEKTRILRENLQDYKKHIEDTGGLSDNFDSKLLEIKQAGQRLAKNSPEIKKPKVQQLVTKAEPDKVSLKVGDTVKMIGLETVGEIIEIGEKSVMVGFGSIITTVDPKKLEPAKQNKKISSATQYSSGITDRKLNFKSDIDIRGKRADEALTIVRDLIDDAIYSGVHSVRVLHGKGNGILRHLIREYLATVDVVEKYHDEHADRGGSGITIAELNY